MYDVAYMRQGHGAAQNNRNVFRLIIDTTTGCRKIFIPTATHPRRRLVRLRALFSL